MGQEVKFVFPFFIIILCVASGNWLPYHSISPSPWEVILCVFVRFTAIKIYRESAVWVFLLPSWLLILITIIIMLLLWWQQLQARTTVLGSTSCNAKSSLKNNFATNKVKMRASSNLRGCFMENEAFKYPGLDSVLSERSVNLKGHADVCRTTGKLLKIRIWPGGITFKANVLTLKGLIHVGAQCATHRSKNNRDTNALIKTADVSWWLD